MIGYINTVGVTSVNGQVGDVTISTAPPLSNEPPKNLADTASAGTSNEASRADHEHDKPSPTEINAVAFTAQTLTDAQKEQARTNIGAITSTSFVNGLSASENGVTTSVQVIPSLDYPGIVLTQNKNFGAIRFRPDSDSNGFHTIDILNESLNAASKIYTSVNRPTPAEIGARPDTWVPAVEDIPGLSEAIAAGAGGVSVELLWTNAAPESNFAEQDLPIDLSGYDLFMVCYYMSTTSLVISAQTCPVGHSISLNLLFGSNGKVGSRRIDDNGTSLTVGSANYDGSTNNKYVIPYKIYGIKGVKNV